LIGSQFSYSFFFFFLSFFLFYPFINLISLLFNTVIKGEPVKIIEVKDTVVKEGKAEALKEISNKLDSIEQKADEVYEKVKKKKKDKKKKKKNN